jgi:hypothetical protein
VRFIPCPDASLPFIKIFVVVVPSEFVFFYRRKSNSGAASLIFVDTNILVNETLEDSERHELATKLFDESEIIILPRVVLLEYIWVMLKRVKVSLDFLVEKVSEYCSDARVQFYCETEEDIKFALSIMKKEKALTSAFDDYLILAIAKNNKTEILTFDSELREIARKYIAK